MSFGHGSMNIHTVYQHNALNSLVNYNDINDMDMNDNLQNVGVISGIGLINIHILTQCN